MIVVLWLVCSGFQVISSSEFVVIEKVAGSDITLALPDVGGSTGISWWFRGHIIADARLEPPKSVYIYPNFQPIKNRIDINNSTGHMTLRALNEEDSGYYRAEAVENNTKRVTHIKLLVAAHPAEVVVKPSGSAVILTPQYTGAPTEVSWWRGPHLLARLQHGPPPHVTFYHFGGIADVNTTTGHLIIRSIAKGDAGGYRAQALVSGVFQHTLINVTVTDDGHRGLSEPAIAGIVIAVIAPLVVLGILLYKWGHEVTKLRAPPVLLVSARCHQRIFSIMNGKQNQIRRCECTLCRSSPSWTEAERTEAERTEDANNTPSNSGVTHNERGLF